MSDTAVVTVRYFDPRPPVSDSLVAPPRKGLGAGPHRIGLLANGFPDSMAFLDAVAAALAETEPATTFVRIEKASPPTPLTTAQLRSLTNDCDAVIAAYGH